MFRTRSWKNWKNCLPHDPLMMLSKRLATCCLATANLARHHHVDPEAALRAANLKFERRFRAMEAMTGPVPFPDLSLAQQEALWQAVKPLPPPLLRRKGDDPAADAGPLKG